MIIKERILKTRVIDIKDIFSDIQSKFNRDRCNKISNIKNIIFARLIGIEEGEDEKTYSDKIYNLDKAMKSLNTGYILVRDGLYNEFSNEDIKNMQRKWDEYNSLVKQNNLNKDKLYCLDMGYILKNSDLEWTKKNLFEEIMNQYKQNNPSSNESNIKNFGIKFLIWMNKYLKILFDRLEDGDTIPKFIYYGDIKKNDQYFLLFLSRLGCDVLYINPKEDIKDLVPQIVKNSVLLELKLKAKQMIRLNEASIINRKINTQRENNDEKLDIDKNKKILINKIKKEANINKSIDINKSNTNISRDLNNTNEKTYEELAKLAKSVVLIDVYNESEDLVGRGSGVVVTRDGFILTNFHVIQGGAFYKISFENDETQYLTDSLVKYHQDFDLALIKIDKKTQPLSINPNENLVRGQKIVAIGSPLGLFNTISDGIISGFREIRSMEVIQITAPISPGSSGGALIDLYGNLIGITSAGFEGQNLNLAVSTKYIKLFANQIIR